jgi:multiple sugar transport system permease protein
MASLQRAQSPALAATGRLKGRWRDTALAYLYILPAAVVLLAFRLYPVGNAIYISFHKWGIKQEAFVGLENYRRLLADPSFWQAWRVTVFYVLVTVPFTMFLALVLAVILYQKIALRGLYRTLYFIPYVTSLVAAAMVWKWIFNKQWGVLNFFITKLGGEPLGWLLEPRGIVQLLTAGSGWRPSPWLAGPSLALIAVSMMSIWHFLGYDIVIYLAGLGNISSELYEAARIDGANEWHIFWRITLPLLSPTTFFLLIISTIGAFRSFNQFYVMTSGGPLGTTTTVAYFVFQNFYQFTKVGYASGAAVLLFVAILIMTILQLRFGRQVTYQ